MLLVIVALTTLTGQPASDTLVPLPGLGSYSRPITTRSAPAQAAFDQGLRLLYAFNHAEAERAFAHVVRLDSTASMGHWGLAMVASPYLDRGHSPALDARAREHGLAALRTARDAKPAERELAEALVLRYPEGGSGPAADSMYATALGRLARKYPRDPDLAALFAEAVMVQHRRAYWEGSRLRSGVEPARAALEAALRIDSLHPLANHLYIHLFEMAHDPAPAIPAAERMQRLAPGAGHLLHMSSHILARVGRYEEAAEANRRAWQADREYFALANPPPTSTYVAGYHLHTLHFLYAVLGMQRKPGQAMAVAESLAARISPAAAGSSTYQQSWTAAPLMVALRFSDWERIRAMPAPAETQLWSSVLWHHAQAMASANRGELEPARAHFARLETAVGLLPAPASVAPTAKALPLGRMAQAMTRARIAEGEGDLALAERALRQAIAIQDSLGHMEPPPWYQPVRQALGQFLLRQGRAADAAAVFQEDLAVHPGNPWSLAGLEQARVSQGCSVQGAACSGVDEKQEVLAVISRMLQAMEARDTAMLAGVFIPSAKLVGMRTRAGESVPFVQELTVTQFGNFLARDSRGPWIERLWAPVVQVEGTAAAVWAQYDFHFGQRFSHCGVDAFHLLKTAAGWKIAALADTYQLEGCPARPVPNPGGPWIR